MSVVGINGAAERITTARGCKVKNAINPQFFDISCVSVFLHRARGVQVTPGLSG